MASGSPLCVCIREVIQHWDGDVSDRAMCCDSGGGIFSDNVGSMVRVVVVVCLLVTVMLPSFSLG